MNRNLRLSHGGLLMLAILFATSPGCDEIGNRISKKAMEQGEEASRAGEHRRARDLYERALDGTARTADAHFRLGLLCDEHLNDPAGASYHYGRYLDFAPTGSKAAEAKRLRSEVRREVARSTGDSSLLAKELARLKNENQNLQKETIRLRARGERTKGLNGSSDSTEQKARQVGRTYVVEPGDTLAGISRKFFKTPSRWKDIQDANFQQIGDKTSLKPGQTLIIPEP